MSLTLWNGLDFMIIGVTGGLGCGKSTVAKALSIVLGLPLIEVDELRRYALWHSTEPRHIELRISLAVAMELETSSPEFWLNRAKLTEKIFKNRGSVELFAHLTKEAMRELAMANLHHGGVIAWSRLLADGYVPLLRGPLVLVECPVPVRLARLSLEGPTEEACHRIKLEPTFREQRWAHANIPDLVLLDNSGTIADLTPVLQKIEGKPIYG